VRVEGTWGIKLHRKTWRAMKSEENLKRRCKIGSVENSGTLQYDDLRRGSAILK